MINFLKIFKDPETRDDKLRRMWTKIYEEEQRKKHDQEIKEDKLYKAMLL